MLQPHSEEERAEWRDLRDPRDDPAEIYGKPVPGRPVRVFVWQRKDDRRLVQPAEAPRRYLLLLDGGVDDVIQADGVLMVCSILTAAGVALIVGKVLLARQR